MTNQTLKMLFESLGAGQSGGVEKTAAAQAPSAPAPTAAPAPAASADVTKLASDARAMGAFIAEGFFDRLLQKQAMEGLIPAAGAGTDPRSVIEMIADRIHQMKGKGAVGMIGDDTSIRAEQAGAISGAMGNVNPANYRG